MTKGGSKKGSPFEREVAVRLSLWWTSNRDDSIFWRTDSGARATRRGQKGKSTAGQCGDIIATLPEGAPLLAVITWELKRGYSKSTIHDLLDKPADAAMQKLESWIKQAQQSAANAKSLSWAILHKRDQRESMIYFPRKLLHRLRGVGAFADGGMSPLAVFKVRLRQDHEAGIVTYPVRELVVTTLECFFRYVKPDHVRELAEKREAA